MWIIKYSFKTMMGKEMKGTAVSVYQTREEVEEYIREFLWNVEVESIVWYTVPFMVVS